MHCLRCGFCCRKTEMLLLQKTLTTWKEKDIGRVSLLCLTKTATPDFETNKLLCILNIEDLRCTSINPDR